MVRVLRGCASWDVPLGSWWPGSRVRVCTAQGRVVSAARRWPWPSVQQELGDAGFLALCGLWNGSNILAMPPPSLQPSSPPVAVAPAPCRMFWVVLGCVPRSLASLLAAPWLCRGQSPDQLFLSERAWQVWPQCPGWELPGDAGSQPRWDQGWMGTHPLAQSPGLSQGHTWCPKRPACPSPSLSIWGDPKGEGWPHPW